MVADALIKQLAVEMGVPSLALNVQGVARLGIDGRWNVDMEWDEGNGVLHLYAVVGRLPPRNRENVLVDLLSANYLGLDTAGAAFSIAPGSEEVLLCTRVTPETVTFADFKALLERFLSALDRLAPVILGNANGRESDGDARTISECELSFLTRV